MTETEEIEAMKRSYAEMILNTAKEAAASVMAAELRARRMEQELVSIKEEAAGMLLRLKQMIDAKSKEAEITSLNQQTKHDELECQLNEAEGIILDLRAELKQAHRQLAEMKNKKVPAKRQNEENAEEFCITPEGTCSGYELLTSSLISVTEFSTVGGNNFSLDCSTLEQNCCSPAKQTVNFNSECDYSGDKNAVLDQMKEPEQFKNGCTQRVCATVTSLVEETFPAGEKSNPSKNSTNIETVNAVRSPSILEENVQHGKRETVSIVRRSLRKRKLKFWDDVISACGLHRSYQFKKPHQAFPHLSCFRTSKVKSCVKKDEDPLEYQTQTGSLNHGGVPKSLIHAKALPENMELIDVLVKQDELAATCQLASSSKIDCDVECGTSTVASNISYPDGKKHCKYKFNRKWKKKSMIYPKKSS